MSDLPDIKPYNKAYHTVKQSKYDVVSELPVRSLLLAPSNSGKTVMLQNIILDIYRNCFSEDIHLQS